jgi:DNA-binding transcriptional regulator YiaG
MSQPARQTVIDQWTGRHATALQAAMRMSQDEMAALIGVAKRTVAAWSESRRRLSGRNFSERSTPLTAARTRR